MQNDNYIPMHRNADSAAPKRGGDASTARPGPGLPPEALAPRLAELKRQIAWRQAMA